MIRNFLTNQQRTRIQAEIRKQRQDKTLNLKRLAEWARRELNLSFTPSRPVLSRLSSSADDTAAFVNDSAKRTRKPAQEELEKRLLQWVNDCAISKTWVTGDKIREKGRSLLEEVNRLLPETEKIDFKFSAGWLWRFQKRWNLNFCKMNGDDADPDGEKELTRLRELCNQFAVTDIWNAGETGLNFAMSPDRTVSNRPLPGREEKKRMTILLCANANGTEKFPLLFIGNAKQPRSFNSKSGEELGFDYGANKQASMTMSVFFNWLQRFDSFIARSSGRKVLLLLGNVSGHGSQHCLPELSSVQVEFVPCNTASRLQPMDSGIIASVKRRYRMMQYDLALDNLELKEDVYNIDQLTAMRYLKAIWTALPLEVISNCWQMCGFLSPSTSTVTALNNSVSAEEEKLSVVISKLTTLQTRMSVRSLLNADDYDMLEHLNDADIAQSVVEDLNGNLTEGREAEDPGRIEARMSCQEQISAVLTCLRVVECQETMNLELVHHLRALLRSLKNKSKSTKPTSGTQSSVKKRP